MNAAPVVEDRGGAPSAHTGVNWEGLEEAEEEVGSPVERGVGDGQRHRPQGGRQPPDRRLHQRVATGGGGEGAIGVAPRPALLPALPAGDGVGALVGGGALEGAEGLDGDAAVGERGRRGGSRLGCAYGVPPGFGGCRSPPPKGPTSPLAVLPGQAGVRVALEKLLRP